jgi:ABC-type glycerol-3-phosphate transport system permease component
MQKDGVLGRRAMQVIVGVFVAVWSLLPIYWAAVVAVSQASDIRMRPVSLVPRSFSLDAFVDLLTPSSANGAAFLQGVTNSVIQASATTAVTLLVAFRRPFWLSSRPPWRCRSISC